MRVKEIKRSACLTALLMAAVITLKSQPAHALIINEVLADPPAGNTGDANGDNNTSSIEDEFVELFNPGTSGVDLSGWSLADGYKTRHVFPDNTFLEGGQYLVVFGGGSPQITDVYWQTASTGSLGLNNSGDTVTLYDTGFLPVYSFAYGKSGGDDQSLVLWPEGTGADYVLHSTVSTQGELFSPGRATCPQDPGPGSITGNNSASSQAATPEWPGFVYCALGLIWSGLIKAAEKVRNRI